MKCEICEIGCHMEEESLGKCRMYTVKDGVMAERFPHCYSTMFPISIETMPALHFYPNHKFLQVSSMGCNFSCGGCISEILTTGTETLSAALKQVSPEKVVEKALSNGCKGIAFCINDPTVSFFSFCSLARLAKENHLMVGFSTNGYFTRQALDQLIPFTDFVNIGVKGFSDDRYKPCGVPSAAPVFRNIRHLFEAGVHVEVAAIYMKGLENEVRKIAAFVASLSMDIPLQIMRFVPFGEAVMEFEPSIRESESLCRELKKQLSHVYLFNAPGSEFLDTCCPDCGRTMISREFFGPMGSRNIETSMPGNVCSCGKKVAIKGTYALERYNEYGFFGGYRTTRAFEMLHAIMVCIGADDPEKLSALWFHLIETDYLRAFHELVQLPESYGEIIDYLAKRAGQEENGNLLKQYIQEKFDFVQSRTQDVKRPLVYYAMGYPLFALNPERFETNLVQAAGGTCVNKQLTREGKPGFTLTKEEFMALNPDIIFISGFLSCPVSDFYDYCVRNDLGVNAVKNRRIYDHFPSWDFGSPRWILGLMHIAGILHPGVFSFKMEEEADEFYQRFYHKSFDATHVNRSFYRG